MNEMIGKCIMLGEQSYRIIFQDLKKVCMINMGTSEFDIMAVEISAVNTILEIQGDHDTESHKYFDKTRMSERAERNYETAMKIVKEIEINYGPTYLSMKGDKKGIIKMLSLKYGVSVKTIWKYIRRYLQSGFDLNSLIDARYLNSGAKNAKYKNRTGRKNKSTSTSEIIFDDSVKRLADQAIQTYAKLGRELSIRGAYQMFIDHNYSFYNEDTCQLEWLPPEKRPTYRQFDYYFRQKLSKQDLDEIRTSKMEVLNSNRILTSSSRAQSLRPGWVVECDAVEFDTSLVAMNDPEQTVGRPIVYLMVDALTSCILAISVSFENNSIIGLTSLLVNLAEDKVELCKRYGITLDPASWPSCVIPNEIRCDRGSDFVSDTFKKMCRSLNIQLNYESPGVGSKKGIVEQTFHQFQTSMRASLAGNGLITKRHDSKHHEQAMLNISAFTKLALNYVIYHNRHVIKDYPLSKQMLEDPNFIPMPYQLWEHYASLKGVTRQINDTNRNNYLFHLLLQGEARISRRGVEYKGLLYINNDPELFKRMYESKEKKKFDIKYDPRNTSRLYYEENKTIKILKLNDQILHNTDFKDMTWLEYEEYRQKRAAIRRKAEDAHLEQNAGLKMKYGQVIEGERNEILPSDENINFHRKKEKHLHNKLNPISIQDECVSEIEHDVFTEDESCDYSLDDSEMPKFEVSKTRKKEKSAEIENELFEFFLESMEG